MAYEDVLVEARERAGLEVRLDPRRLFVLGPERAAGGDARSG
jgi:hypothetical protein